MNENDKKTSGGMYRGVKVPVKLLDTVITVGILLLCVITAFGIFK